MEKNHKNHRKNTKINWAWKLHTKFKNKLRFKNLLENINKNKESPIFRDNGISISISIMQLGIEIINQIIYYSYIFIFHGKSNFLDKLFGLYLIAFTMIIQPAFYLNGDFKFRRNWAFKIALFGWCKGLFINYVRVFLIFFWPPTYPLM